MATATASDGTVIEWTSEGVGPALLLIAGQASSMHGWTHVLPELAETHTVIRAEHRGIGGSAIGDPDRLTTRHLAQDAVAVLDAAGIERADVYGHSMGGRIAQWLAVDAPERVGRLVLAATTGGDARGVRRAPSATAILASGDRDALCPLLFSSAFEHEHPDAVDAVFTVVSTPAAQRLHFGASSGHDAWDALARITAPTLVVHGTADLVTPPGNAEQLAKSIPAAELHLEVGGLHGLHLESTAVRARILRFLAAAA